MGIALFLIPGQTNINAHYIWDHTPFLQNKITCFGNFKCSRPLKIQTHGETDECDFSLTSHFGIAIRRLNVNVYM